MLTASRQRLIDWWPVRNLLTISKTGVLTRASKIRETGTLVNGRRRNRNVRTAKRKAMT